MNLQNIILFLLLIIARQSIAQTNVTLLKGSGVYGAWKFRPGIYAISGYYGMQPKSDQNEPPIRSSTISERYDIVLNTIDSICLEGICVIEKNAIMRGKIRYIGQVSRPSFSGDDFYEERYERFVVTLKSVKTRDYGLVLFDASGSTDTIDIRQSAASGEHTMEFVGEIKQDYLCTVKGKIPTCIQGIPNAKELPRKRLALIIGNSNYAHKGILTNPCHDAQDIRDSLCLFGFKVMYKENLSTLEMLDAIRTFRDSLANYDVGWFYFAGHGVEVDGSKYLIPVNAQLKHKDHLAKEAIELQYIEFVLKDKIGLITVDVCRDNPFEFSMGKGLRGFVLEQSSGKGSLLSAFATLSGKNASDDHPNGRNGNYTGCLLKAMTGKCLIINNIFSVAEGELANQVATHTSEGMGLYYLTRK